MPKFYVAALLVFLFLGTQTASATECYPDCDYTHDYGPYDFTYIRPACLVTRDVDRVDGVRPFSTTPTRNFARGGFQYDFRKRRRRSTTYDNNSVLDIKPTDLFDLNQEIGHCLLSERKALAQLSQINKFSRSYVQRVISTLSRANLVYAMRFPLTFPATLATLIATVASAMPINNRTAVGWLDANVENVRIVCNSHGYCRSTKPHYVRQYYAPRNYSYDSYAARDYGYAPRSYAPLLNYSYAPLYFGYYGYAVPGYYGYFPLYYGDFSPGYW